MARNWPSLKKLGEEPSELITEVMKLMAFPNGKHPGRRRNVVLSMEDEMADVIGIINYTIDRERLNRARIEKRAKSKYREFSKWWGIPKIFQAAIKKAKK